MDEGGVQAAGGQAAVRGMARACQGLLLFRCCAFPMLPAAATTPDGGLGVLPTAEPCAAAAAAAAVAACPPPVNASPAARHYFSPWSARPRTACCCWRLLLLAPAAAPAVPAALTRNSALFLGQRPWPMLLPSFLAWLVRPTPPAENMTGMRGSNEGKVRQAGGRARRGTTLVSSAMLPMRVLPAASSGRRSRRRCYSYCNCCLQCRVHAEPCVDSSCAPPCRLLNSIATLCSLLPRAAAATWASRALLTCQSAHAALLQLPIRCCSQRPPAAALCAA